MKPHRMKRTSMHGACTFLALLTLPALSFAQNKGTIDTRLFGTMPDGTQIFSYTLKNPSGMSVEIISYGGRIATISVPGRNKHFQDVVLGFDNLKQYLGDNPFFGAIIGRYANRIANGTFTLDGKTYHIPVTDGKNALHGGKVGFDKRVWRGKPMQTSDGPAVELHYLSRNGEEGFPGNLNVRVRYTLESDNGLRIDYYATTDQDTVVNFTNHSYFNLSGAGNPSILNEELMIDANSYTPINAGLIPTGQIAPVAGTPLDFRKLTKIGSRIDDNNQQLKYAGGYDFNYVLNHPGDLSALAAKVVDPASGRVMEVFTTEPGIQFYTSNMLQPIHGIGGLYRRHSALTLETQHFPDSPNHPNFPSTVLHPGQQFHSTTIYRFSVQ
jgi:aldose 1-epimerase